MKKSELPDNMPHPANTGERQKLYIETYGCQMNVNDSEIVASLMYNMGYDITEDMNNADLIFINTCSIRENAETRVRGRLNVFRQAKKKNPGLLVGVIGCMAERLKEQLIKEEEVVDLVIGPDAYRDLPELLSRAESGHKAINVILSKEETYDDITPVRLDKNKVSAFVSIMRGCNNLCAYCVVPYTRGRERSRDAYTILSEIEDIRKKGYREITLLGQNVNSYLFEDQDRKRINFPALLEMVADKFPDLWIRYSTSHPKDMSDELLKIMASRENICNHVHLPVQSGSTRVLKTMKRRYTREEYMNRVEAIRKILPDHAITTDLIAGFCGETDEDHKDTLDLMKWTGYDFAFMFKYSERPGTFAAENYEDDVPEDVKTRRLTEIIDLQNRLSYESKKKDLGKEFDVLVEGVSKRSAKHLYGRNKANKVIVFPKDNYQTGDIARVKIADFTSATLIGELL